MMHTYQLFDENVPFVCISPLLALLLVFKHQSRAGYEIRDKGRGCFIAEMKARWKRKSQSAVPVVHY
jgi:hypothetical protein